jgi:hypothetical protein
MVNAFAKKVSILIPQILRVNPVILLVPHGKILKLKNKI